MYSGESCCPKTVSPAATLDAGGGDTDDPGVAAGGGGRRVDCGRGPHTSAATVHQADAVNVKQVRAGAGAGAHNLQVNHVGRWTRGELSSRASRARSSQRSLSANTHIPARHTYLR